jgi:hypothetical protein
MIELSKALDLVIQNCQLDQIDDVSIIEERSQWLESSSALNLQNVKNYRPYYVTALHYWLLPENNLISGEGAKFDQNYEVTRRYLLMQRNLDLMMSLQVETHNSCDTLLGTMSKECQTCNDPTNELANISIMGF